MSFTGVQAVHFPVSRGRPAKLAEVAAPGCFRHGQVDQSRPMGGRTRIFVFFPPWSLFFLGGSKWPTSLWLRCSWPGVLPFRLCATQRRTPRMPVVVFHRPQSLLQLLQLSASAVSGEMLGLGHGGTSSANCSFGCHPGGLRRVSERKVARKL